MTDTAPGPDLLRRIRLGFLLQDSTYTAWCRKNSVHPTVARQAILGTWNGQKGRQLRARITRAAKVDAVPDSTAGTTP